MHAARVKEAGVAREERITKGSEGWRVFLTKGWEAVQLVNNTTNNNNNNTPFTSINNVPPSNATLLPLVGTSTTIPNSN